MIESLLHGTIEADFVVLAAATTLLSACGLIWLGLRLRARKSS